MYQDVQTKLDEIVTEMKLIGLWQDEPLPPDKYNFRAPFALDTMAFNQWLQFIFVPRVTQILSSQGTFPMRSQVGAQAIREYDSVPEAARLVELLCAFDALF
ncbi:MAG: YqcC family protein [Chloroflexi bacterium]|nr:YqcC family protein [Chloroflexota bacterium]MBP8057646.1 YqcC family protein [Chloroflexota bacterium]